MTSHNTTASVVRGPPQPGILLGLGGGNICSAAQGLLYFPCMPLHASRKVSEHNQQPQSLFKENYGFRTEVEVFRTHITIFGCPTVLWDCFLLNSNSSNHIRNYPENRGSFQKQMIHTKSRFAVKRSNIKTD